MKHRSFQEPGQVGQRSPCVGGRPVTSTKQLYQMLYSYNCPPEDEHIPRSCSKHVEDSNKHIIEETEGHAVAQLRYKTEGRGFDFRWCHWIFSLT